MNTKISGIDVNYYPAKESTDKLIIVSNAFCANQESYPIYKQFAEAAAHSGFNVVTYDYTGRGNSAGAQIDATISGHIKDLATIIEYYQTCGLPNWKQPKIALVGHSLGGIVSTNNDTPEIKGIVLWNSPKNMYNSYHNYAEDMKTQGFTERTRGDKKIIVGKKMWEEFLTIEHNMNPFEYGKVCAIIGEQDQILKHISLNDYQTWASCAGKNPVIILDGSNDHNFDLINHQAKVIDNTINYLNTRF